jgi:hypothetical protein
MKHYQIIIINQLFMINIVMFFVFLPFTLIMIYLNLFSIIIVNLALKDYLWDCLVQVQLLIFLDESIPIMIEFFQVVMHNFYDYF